MSRWSKKESAPKPIEQESVDGSFVCQTCGKYVYSAVYLRLDQILTWKCSEGHKSYIKDFVV